MNSFSSYFLSFSIFLITSRPSFLLFCLNRPSHPKRKKEKKRKKSKLLISQLVMGTQTIMWCGGFFFVVSFKSLVKYREFHTSFSLLPFSLLPHLLSLFLACVCNLVIRSDEGDYWLCRSQDHVQASIPFAGLSRVEKGNNWNCLSSSFVCLGFLWICTT